MRYEITPAFEADYRRPSKRERGLFRDAVIGEFSPACDNFAAEPSVPFAARLRVKPVQDAPGLFEMTWSFAGPDGRATFEWTEIDGQRAVRWRRIGSHRILRDLKRE